MKRKLKKAFIETCKTLGSFIFGFIMIGLILCGLKSILDLIIFNEFITITLSALITLFLGIFVTNILSLRK